MTTQTTPMTTADHTPILTHPFTESGLGAAPFRFVGTVSIPSPSLAEANCEAYNNALRALPRNLVNGCGTCGHCGMPIMHIFIVENAEGKRYGVGCKCIEKTGDAKLSTVAKEAAKKMERAKRAAKAEEKRLARHEAAVARRKAHEASPEGIAAAKAKAEAELAAIARRKAIAEETAPLGERLKDGQGGFRDSVAFDLIGGSRIGGRAAQIACDILAKQCGRGNSKAYEAEANRIWPLLTGEASE